MKYGFKIVRDTQTERYTVFPVQELPSGVEGYRVKYNRVGTAEALRVFDTKAEADNAYAAECEVARLSTLPTEERRLILWNRLERLKEYRIAAPAAAKLTGITFSSLYDIMHRRAAPSVRQTARIVVAIDALTQLVESLPTILPPVNLTGRPRPGHFVQAAIYKNAPSYRKRRSAKPHA